MNPNDENRQTYQIDSNNDNNQNNQNENADEQGEEYEGENNENNEINYEEQNPDDQNQEEGEYEEQNNNEDNQMTENSLNQNREQFIEKFQGQHNTTKTGQNMPKKRWDYLYTQSKLQKMKIDNERKNKLEEREKEIIAECTFSPKLNKNYNFRKDIYNLQDPDDANKDFVPNIAVRQSTWNEKKRKKIDDLKKTKNNKELEECYFAPETVRNIFIIIK